MEKKSKRIALCHKVYEAVENLFLELPVAEQVPKRSLSIVGQVNSLELLKPKRDSKWKLQDAYF